MSNTRKITFLVLAIAIIFSLVLIFYVLRDNSVSEAINTEVLASSGFDVKPESMDTSGVKLDSDLRITINTKQDESYIKNNLKVQPAAKYELKKLSNKEYLVDFTDELKPNAVYKVSMLDTNNEELTWAFQTEKTFQVVSNFPRDEGIDVPVESGIELQFSYPYVENVKEYFEIDPKVEGEFIYNKNLVVFMPTKPLKPDTVYNVTVKAGVGLKDSDEVTKEDTKFKFITKPDGFTRSSLFNFRDLLYNFSTERAPFLEVYANAKIHDEEFNVDVYSYDNVDDFIADNRKISEASPFWLEKGKIEIEIDEGLNKVTTFKTKLINDAESGSLFLEFPNKLEEGYYLIDVSFLDEKCQVQLQVNDESIYIMRDENEYLAWVNDSNTGKAINGAIFELETGESAKTNSDGIAIIPNKSLDNDSKSSYLKVSSDNHLTYVAKIESQADDYGDKYYYRDSKHFWNYLYMDRGVYLPTDRMNYWGIVKSRDNSKKLDSVTIHLYKDDYTNRYEIDKKEVELDDFGCLQGEWKFEDFLTGNYMLEITYDDKVITNRYFDIRRYEKPIYSVKAEFDKERIFLWDSATLNINAKFFEGSPVSGLKLTSHYHEGADNESYIKCDENGSSTVEYTPDFNVSSWSPRYIYFYLDNAQAEDENVSTYARMLVFPKDMMLNIDTKVNAKDESLTDIEIRTNMIDIDKKVDEDSGLSSEEMYSGKPVDTDIQIVISEREYVKDGTTEHYNFITQKVEKSYSYKSETSVIDKISAKTKDGKYKLSIPMDKDKDYEISVTTTDTRGNSILKEKRLFSSSRYYNTGSKRYYIRDTDFKKNNYRIGDKVNLVMVAGYNTDEVKEIPGDKLLLLKMRDGLQEYIVSDDLKETLVFNEEDIPNYYIKAVYFDGKDIYPVGSRSINYDYSEKELDINVKSDKENYRPGETVELEFEVKDEVGKPQKTNLNISVVDEALFALGDQYVDILSTLYNYYFDTGIISDYLSNQEVIRMLSKPMAEGGGDGYDESSAYIRKEFLDTAIFKTLTTDANGKGSISFKLPDNLTSWRVTYQGITEDLSAANGTTNINTKLPYFITLISSNTYMTGDKPYLSVRSYGTETANNDSIDYKVTLEKQGGDKKEFEIEGKGNEYANINLGELTKGKYTITAYGKNGSYSDAIQKEFEVIDSMVKSTIVQNFDLKNDTKIPSDKGYVTVDFYNKECSNFYNILTSLAYTYGDRVDQMISKKIGTEMMNKYFDSGFIEVESKLEEYQVDDGGIALLPYSSSDPLLSAKLVSLAPDSFRKTTLIEYFKMVIEDKESTQVNKAAAYWGLASLNEPVLIDIQRILKNEELNIKSEMLYTLGLLEFGDVNNASIVYKEIKEKYSKKSGEYTYVDTGIDKDDILEATSLMSIIALRLDEDEKYSLIEYVKSNRAKTILTKLEQAMFAKYDKPNVSQEVSFTYSLDGKENDVKLVNTNSHSIILSEEEAKNIIFKNINGDVTASVKYSGNIKESDKEYADNFSLNRTYRCGDDSDNKFRQSNLIEVTLKPNFSKSAQEGYYEITDIIPAGLRYVSMDYNRDISHPIEVDGQKLVFSYYYDKTSKLEPITYRVRATTPGEYTADNAVIMHYESNSINLSEQIKLSISQ